MNARDVSRHITKQYKSVYDNWMNSSGSDLELTIELETRLYVLLEIYEILHGKKEAEKFSALVELDWEKKEIKKRGT